MSKDIAFRGLMDALPHACIRVKIQTDAAGEPTDFVVTGVNHAAERHLGLNKEQIIGKSFREVLTSLGSNIIDLMDVYRKVILDGNHFRFEHYFDSLKWWFSITAYCDEPGFLTCIFCDISQRKTEKNALVSLAHMLEDLLEIPGESIDYRQIAEAMRKLSGAKFTIMTLYDPDQDTYTTVALAGVDDELLKAASLFGFELTGSVWKYPPERETLLQDKVTSRFSNVVEFTTGTLPRHFALLLQKTFQTGETLLVKMFSKGKILGNFTLIMPRGKACSNLQVVELFSRHVDLLLARLDVEKALSESEYEKSLILDSAKEIFVYLDCELKIQWANKTAALLAGMERKEMVGSLCHEIWHKRSDPCPGCPVLQARETGKPAEGQMVDAQNRILHLRGYPVLSESGEVTALIEFGQDITISKKIEEELRQERRLFRTIIDHLPDAVYAKDSHARKLLSNPVDVEHLGLETEQDALGKCDFDIYPPEVAEQFARDDRYVLETGKPIIDKEEKSFTKDGSERWVLTRKVPLRDEGGRIIGIVGIGRDITVQKIAQEALLKSEEKFKRIVNNVQDIIYSVDVETREFSYLSPSFEKILGYTEEDIRRMGGRQKFMSKVLQDNSFALQEKELEEIKSTKARGQYRNEAWWRCRDGTLKCLEDISTPVYEGEKLVSTDGVLRDITVRKQAEERIRYLSFHDTLTDLYNRAYLEEEMQRVDTERQLPIWIILVDLNGLKLVNDAFGHRMGDRLLQAAASVLKKVCRKEDLIARWGGDEFVVLLPRTSQKEAESIVKRISQKCGKTEVDNIPISLSLGTAGKKGLEEDLTVVLQKAEDAMYQHKLVESRKARSAILRALQTTLQRKGLENTVHIERSLKVATRFGEVVGLPPSDIERLKLLSRLRDIGKITLSEDILRKPGPLTEEEREHVQHHPETGYRIARSTDELARIAEEILTHHEHWDGTGYPRRLKGENIPFLSRLMAIVDVYIAMTSSRPYRQAMSREKAVAEIERFAGSQFDPALVEVFVKMLREEPEQL